MDCFSLDDGEWDICPPPPKKIKEIALKLSLANLIAEINLRSKKQ